MLDKPILCNKQVAIFERGEDEFYVVPLTEEGTEVMRWTQHKVMSFVSHVPYARKEVPADVIAKAKEQFKNLPLAKEIEGSKLADNR